MRRSIKSCLLVQGRQVLQRYLSTAPAAAYNEVEGVPTGLKLDPKAIEDVANDKKLKISKVLRHDEKRLLEVQWTDGRKGKFAYPWLLDNASTAFNAGSRNIARKLIMGDLDTELVPHTVSVSADGQTVLFTLPDQDKSLNFQSDWLRARNMNEPGFRKHRMEYMAEDHQTWGPEDYKKREVGDYKKMMNDDVYLRDRLEEFMKYGILKITNAPTKSNTLADFGQRIGYFHNGHHGKKGHPGIFEVVVEVDPCNLMNTPRTLGLHTDFPQCQQPPEVQTLHVIKQAGKGGESQFCDGFRVAEQLRIEKPDVYKTLCESPIEFIDWGEYNYRYIHCAKWRTIEFDSDNRYYGIFFNNAIRSWFLDVPAENIPKLYDAFKIFNEYLYHPRNMIEVKLMPGDMMMFANNRTLHGRSAFELEGADTPITRHLEGCYFNYDVIRSKIRVISEQTGDATHISL